MHVSHLLRSKTNSNKLLRPVYTLCLRCSHLLTARRYNSNNLLTIKLQLFLTDRQTRLESHLEPYIGTRSPYLQKGLISSKFPEEISFVSLSLGLYNKFSRKVAVGANVASLKDNKTKWGNIEKIGKDGTKVTFINGVTKRKNTLEKKHVFTIPIVGNYIRESKTNKWFKVIIINSQGIGVSNIMKPRGEQVVSKESAAAPKTTDKADAKRKTTKAKGADATSKTKTAEGADTVEDDDSDYSDSKKGGDGTNEAMAVDNEDVQAAGSGGTAADTEGKFVQVVDMSTITNLFLIH